MTSRIVTCTCLLVFGTLLLGASIGCGGSAGGASDVATLRPEAWDPVDVDIILIRAQAESNGALLFTGQSYEQSSDDRSDDILGNGAHGPVYRFDPETGSFALTDDAAWVQASGKVNKCDYYEKESGFGYEPQGSPDAVWSFDGRPVHLAGGHLLDFFTATDTSAIAAVTTSGTPPQAGLFLIPSTRGNGQLFHQMFSMIDGSPIGPPLRLPISRPQLGEPDACWSSDDQYVIYYSHFNGHRGVELLSVVPVGQALADALPPKTSDVVCLEYAGPRDEDLGELEIRKSDDQQAWLVTTRLFAGDSRSTVYAFDSTTGSPSTRTPDDWENHQTLVYPFARTRKATSPLQVPDDGRAALLFNGTERTVDGRVPFRIERAFERDAALVVSTEGRAMPGWRVLGQLFHQLHWEETGEPIGTPLRIGISRPKPRELDVGWTPDERFVLYLHRPWDIEVPVTVCAAPVDDVVRAQQPVRTSDVPCLDPVDWADQGTKLLIRRDGDNDGALFFTHLTEAQDETSPYGGQLSYNDHGAVYRYDPLTERFSKTEKSRWESSDTPVINCRSLFFRYNGRFEPCVTDAVVKWDGQGSSSVAGGTGVGIFRSYTKDVTAILSSDRPGMVCLRPTPGQHLHQMYSHIMTEPVGELLRVGVGGMAVDAPGACWTEDDEYVVYFQEIPGVRHIERLCVVDASR